VGGERVNGTGDAVVQARNGRAPIRWGAPAPEQADPMGGRHAFDSEAALTPIFTTLRRSGQCAQPDPALRPSRPLWPVPDQVERFRDDPWTAEIPVVPPLHVVPDPVPPPSALETTMMWHAVDGPMVPQPPAHAYEPVQRFDGYAPGYEPAPYEPEVHAPAGYDRYGYDSAPYEPAGYDPAVYDLAPYEPYQDVPQVRRPYDSGGYDRGGYDQRGYDRGGYDRGGYDRGGYDQRFDRGGYDPVKDTGRHHVRLAPAGW
jgi:hypothetical protein